MEIKVQDVKIGQQVTIASEFSGNFTGVLVRFEERGPLAGPDAVIAVIRQEGGTEVSVKTYKPFPAYVQEEKHATAQQILTDFLLPAGFDYQPIGFTADAWVVTAPNGAELEFGTVTDDGEDFEGYSWQEYDTEGMEDGNVIETGGTEDEDDAREALSVFVKKNTQKEA